MMRISIVLFALLTLNVRAGVEQYNLDGPILLQPNFADLVHLFSRGEILSIVEAKKALDTNPHLRIIKYKKKILSELYYYLSFQFLQKLNFLDFIEEALAELKIPPDKSFETIYDRITSNYKDFCKIYSISVNHQNLTKAMNNGLEGIEREPLTLEFQAMVTHLELSEMIEAHVEAFKPKIKEYLKKKLYSL